MEKIGSKRIVWIDCLKAYAIVLVVIGHTIQCVISPSDYDNNIVFEMIYGFHMPLFMFISGFLTYHADKKIDFSWLKKRFLMLAVPFMVCTLIICLARHGSSKTSMLEYLLNVIKSPDYSVWFIWVLFLANIVLFLIDNLLYKFFHISNNEIFKRALAYGTVTILLRGFVILTEINVGGLGLLSWHIFFFLLGNLYNCYLVKTDKSEIIKNNWLKILIILVSLFMLSMWRRCEPPIFVGPALKSNAIMLILVNLSYSYIVAIGGVAASIYLIRFIPDKISNKISYIGKYTIEIYLIDTILGTTKSYTGYIVTDTILSIAISITLPIITSKLLDKSTFHKILFGK